NRPGASHAGLFALLGREGEIRNLTLENCWVTGETNVGALVAYNSEGTVVNCSSNGPVTGQFYTGGLVGYGYYGVLLDCSTAGTVTGGSYLTGAGASCAGGLLGYNYYGSIENGVATGQVLGDGPIGGLAGVNEYGTIATSYATGAVTATDGNNTWISGGLVGYNKTGSISRSFATGSVTGAAKHGSNQGLGGDKFGGLIGLNNGTVKDCFATGAVTETETSQSYVGGLIGCDYNTGKVTNCFATGPILTSGKNSSSVGGLIGMGGALKACYWDLQTTGRTTSSGGTGGVGKTSAEMKRQATFQPGGGTGANDWDFTSVWGIVEGQSYPYLRFASTPFRLTVSMEGGGSVALNPPGGLYASGTTVTLTATAATGYYFDRWRGAVTNPTAASTALFMDSHKSVTACFRPIYEIRTLAELQAIATGDLEGRYLLMNDLDASDTANWNDAGTDLSLREGFRPIGTRPISFYETEKLSFRGIFDGNGKKITGLTINRPTMNDVGLFSCVGKGGVVKNLTLEGGMVTGHRYTGALIGTHYTGTVTHCATHTIVKGQFGSIGGLIGYNNYGSIAHCSASGVVVGTATENSGLGGLVGYNSHGSIANSFASVAITETGWDSSGLGGLVGSNSYGTLTHCYAIGPVASVWKSGGLVGSDSNSTITACYWDKEVTGWSTSAGSAASFGKTTAEMKQKATFSGWDFASVWGIVEGQSYPYLRSLKSSPPLFQLDVTSLNLGSVALNPAGGVYTPGTVVTLTAKPGTEHHFGKWIGAVTNSTSPSTTIVMDADKSVMADFAINEYALAIESENGYVSKSPYAETYYPYGTTVTLTASPETGYRFTGWTGPVSDPMTATTTVFMDEDTTVAAHFEIDAYLLTIEAENGSVTKLPDQTTYTYGTVVTLTATPDPGYHFI
ncbi:MAG TPA: GLUG motif-containing protein, partial [Candidatus Sumerlaeota bacterium]|nr:GLUG motif-containing protein [Candidatus Sumerlaeota bacterium]